MTNSVVALPLGWAWTSLEEVAELKGGLTLGKKRGPHEHVRPVAYLRVANVQRGFLSLDEVKMIAATESEIEELCLRDGDILFNEGGDRDKLGRGWIWSGELPECIHQNHVFRARLRTPEIVPKLVSMYANWFGQAYFLRNGKQTTNLASINLKTLSKFPFPLPPANEQRRIVAKLEALLARSRRAKDALGAIPALLEQFRQSVLAAAFRGDLTRDWRKANPDVESASKLLERIRVERRRRWEEAELKWMQSRGKLPKDDRWKAQYIEPSTPRRTELPPIPDSWSWATLPELGELARGKSKHRPRNDPRLFGGPYPFIQTGDVARSRGRITNAEQTLSDFGLAQSRLFPAGTVCITIAANIADSAVLAIPACFPDSVVGLIPDRNFASAEYVEFFIRTAKADLAAFAPATAQKNINLEVLSEVAIPVPPPTERLVVEARVAKALAAAQAIEEQVLALSGRCDALDSSVLTSAFRGELVPRDPTDEPASALIERIRAQREMAEQQQMPARSKRRRETKVA
ncbi:restriction endonuclease subunit S [Myxococcus virescens]|uniref:restriction endonuclease subunit S n=1 Tax=Myxococcus virescens TaxID=83456 RepID=UPI003DA55E77